MSAQRCKSQNGFTLLELIIALAIFSIMSVMAYSGLKIVLDSKGITEKHATRLSELQTAMMFMQRDIEQIIARNIRDGFGDQQAPLIGAPFGNRVMEFTRAGWRNPLGGPRSQLQRVGYTFEDGILSRVSWVILDRADEVQPLVRPLIDGVDKLTIRYYRNPNDSSGVDSWPSITSVQETGVLPVMVEVVMEFEDMGKIRRLFQVPGGK